MCGLVWSYAALHNLCAYFGKPSMHIQKQLLSLCWTKLQGTAQLTGYSSAPACSIQKVNFLMQSHDISHVLLTSISYLCVPFLEMLFLAVHLHTHPSKTRTILTSPPSRAPNPLPWCLPCPCARSITGTVWLVRDPPGWGSWNTTLTILRLLGVWVGGTLSVLTSVAGMSIADYLGVLGRGGKLNTRVEICSPKTLG